MEVVVIIIIIAVVIGGAVVNWKTQTVKEQKQLAEQQQLAVQERIAQEKRQQERADERKRLAQERRQREQRKQEKLRRKQAGILRQQKEQISSRQKRENVQKEELIQQVTQQHTQITDQMENALKFRFHFNFFSEESIDALIVIFNEKTDLQNYWMVIHESSQQVVQHLQGNLAGMKAQIDLTESVFMYLIPQFGTADQIPAISKQILADPDKALSAALIVLNPDGHLVGGKVKRLLDPQISPKDSALKAFMKRLRYFVEDQQIIVYFKDQMAWDQTAAKMTSGLPEAEETGQLFVKAKEKIEATRQTGQSLWMKVLPLAITNDKFAKVLMQRMKDESLAQYLVVVNTQNQVVDGLLKDYMLVNQGATKQSSSVVSTQEATYQSTEDANEYTVYEWYVQETGEVFFVGIGYAGKKPSLKQNRLFKRVRAKYATDYRVVEEHLTREAAGEAKDRVMATNLAAGNVLTNIQTPLGYAGGMSTTAERTEYGARRFDYLQAPQVVGNVVEVHYGLIEGSTDYDEIDHQSLKQTTIPNYTLNGGIAGLYFKTGAGDTHTLIERLKVEVQEKANAKIFKSIAKSADSVILTNSPFPDYVANLHAKGYKVFHMVDVIKFLGLDLDQIAEGLEE